MKQVHPLPGSVISLRLYGSYCRGDFDELSDVDVLAVYGERPTEIDRQVVGKHVAALYGHKVDIAEYSKARIEQFFAKGHLFAWHLHDESKSVLSGHDAFFESLGRPSIYGEARSDAEGFLGLLRTSLTEAARPGVSLVYEAGMLYLASRNVAICASHELNKRPDFSRYALYNLCQQLGIQPNVSVSDYRNLMLSRLSSIRGLSTSSPTASWLTETCTALARLCENVIEVCFDRTTHGTVS